METRAQAASEGGLSESCRLRTRSSKRALTERERTTQPASKRPRQPENSKRKRKMNTPSSFDKNAITNEKSAQSHSTGTGPAEASSSTSSSSDDARTLSSSEQRQAALDAAEQDALDMLDESVTRGEPGQSWGGPSNALQGLLRKLGAGLDDLLPSSSSHGRLKTILSSLRGADEGTQLASLSELCEMLSIGTEESMSALSVDAFTPLLIGMLRAEHNPDLMLLASRALCHMMDAIPSSSAAIVHFDGVPLFCERLLSIEYIDLAEQALHALEKLSQEHPLAVLRAGGMLAVLQYVDFFAMGVQRRAVATAANMCRGLPVECAHLVADSVPLLSNMLNHHDQKLLENACLAFARLAESFAHSPAQLEMLAAQGLLPSVLRLVGGMVHGANAQPDAPVQLSDSTYTMLLRTLATLCRGSPSLCKRLLQLDMSSILHDVLATGSPGGDIVAAAVSRPHDQLYQVLSLAYELLPPLPKPQAAGLSLAPSRAASAMAAPKRRSKRGGPASGAESAEESPTCKSASADNIPTTREQALLDEPVLVELYAERLFALFMLVHSAAVNASVRSKSLSCMAKVLHFYPAAGLREMVRRHAIAAFLAPLLTMQDTSAAGMALVMAEILLTKLPSVYTDMFLREGVFDAIARLASSASKPEAAASGSSSPFADSNSRPGKSSVPASSQPLRRTSRGRLTDHASPVSTAAATAPAEALQRRRSSGVSSRGEEGGDSADAPSASPSGSMAPPAPRAPQFASAASMAADATAQVVARAARFHETFVACDPAVAAAVASGEGSESLQKLRSLATAVTDPTLYSTLNVEIPLAGTWTAYADVQALRQLACLLDDVSAVSGVSTFELSKSGLIDGLLSYLTGSANGGDAAASHRRWLRLRAFCTAFLNLPPPSLPSAPTPREGTPSTAAALPSAGRTHGAPPALGALICKLQDVLNMVERFPLSLNESPSSDFHSHGLKALTQPFKLRLTRASGEAAALKEYASNVVLIEPLATVGAIEEFLWPKVRRSEARASHDSEQDEDEDEDEEADDGVKPPARGSSSGHGGPSSAPASAPAAEGRGSGSGGKAPLRSADKAALGSAFASRSSGKNKERGFFRGSLSAGRVGVVLSGLGVALGGDAEGDEEDDLMDEDEDEDEDDEDDEDDGEEGSMVGSPDFGSTLDGSECVHDLQLNSPTRRGDSAKNLSSYMLPPAAPAATSSARRVGGSSRGAAESSSAAGEDRSSAIAPSKTDDSAHAGASPRSAPGSDLDAAASGSADSEASARGNASADRQPKLVLLLNGRPLPYGISIFQAIRQFGASPPPPAGSQVPSSVSSSLSQRLWGSVYTLQYRVVTPADEALTSSSAAGNDDESTILGDKNDSETGPEARVLNLDANLFDGPLGTTAPAMASSPLDPASSVLQLLWFLHRLNEHWSSLYSTVELAEAARARGPALAMSHFTNSKLNAKLMRQLQDPLALCSRCFPKWCGALTSACPFLFSFESRRLFLHSTAFGLSRALQRMHAHAERGQGGPTSSSEPRPESRLGRLPRQKVRISRARVVDSAIKVMELYATQKALLEVEYFGEVGTGLGPTLEFYALVSHELRKAELNLWHHEEVPKETAVEAATGDAGDIECLREKLVHAPCGLFPRPVAQREDGSGLPKRTLQLFTFMGRFVAKAMLDSRLVDLTFAPPFYRHLLGAELGMDDLRELSPHLARSLGQLEAIARERTRILSTQSAGRAEADVAEDVAKLTLHGCPIDQLGLDFTLPGFPEIELVPGGKDKEVTIDTLGEYVQLVLRVMLYDGVKAQITAFKRGFSDVFAVHRLSCFSPAELDVLFNGARERWEKSLVIEQIKFDHGYTRSSRAVGFLLDVISEFSDEQLAAFLKFVTGSPRLPVGGLARLSPRLTIVQKKPEADVSPDAYLPSVMTCANYLKLPDYSSKQVMMERLLTAINEGQGAFLLS